MRLRLCTFKETLIDQRFLQHMDVPLAKDHATHCFLLFYKVCFGPDSEPP